MSNPKEKSRKGGTWNRDNLRENKLAVLLGEAIPARPDADYDLLLDRSWLRLLSGCFL
ncbi:hypothetical protein MPNT_20057 [Candidatus Methylacidithermus pantelleriae]|uniref:Uncharacterized protein n=1 Tax=Candidatus Methylacidithermus pantelleriae TaxID=2744239 RepID=A0A8J2BND6_9BACT|nr:hypothetical protein MPNT_20057 [Candidatus Methylacidithermus pantelleriae]